LEATLGLEQLKTKSALKDLADSESKLAKLGELSDKHGLKVSELQLALKADKKTVWADLLSNKKAALANLSSNVLCKHASKEKLQPKQQL
jgi:hypothetical protein